MKVSYNKLQSYIEDTLPSPEVLAEALSFHFADVESIEKDGDDSILDVKILPDRASYAKSYEGIALEVSAILELQRKKSMIPPITYDRTFTVDPEKVREVLAIDITNEEMASLLRRLDLKVEEEKGGLKLGIPSNRPDLQDWRDIPEEVGRIWGYDKIGAEIPEKKQLDPKPDKVFYYAEKTKNLLVRKGFSEVYTYSLTNKGEYHIEKSVASDKNYLRANLTDGIAKSLELNAKNEDLLGLDEIKIFEVGNVFCHGGEHTALTVGIKTVSKKQKAKKDKDKIKEIRDELLKMIEVEAHILCTVDDSGGIISIKGDTIGITNHVEGIVEIDLNNLIPHLPEPTSYEDLKFGKANHISYKKFSHFPFIVRDIAVFVDESVKADDVWGAIVKGVTDAGAIELLARHSLFDEFKKDGKISYAFRMIFQAMDRTLTDDEVNKVMERVNVEMKANGWEVR